MPEDLLNTSNALGYLRSEHESIEQLLASCEEIPEKEFVRQAMIPLVQELQVHAALENQYFLPLMTEYVPEDRIERTRGENYEISLLCRKLEHLDPNDPDFAPTLDRLVKYFHHHVYEEEQYMFLTVENSTPDTHNQLVRVADQMKAARQKMLGQGKTVSVPKSAIPDPDTLARKTSQTENIEKTDSVPKPEFPSPRMQLRSDMENTGHEL